MFSHALFSQAYIVTEPHHPHMEPLNAIRQVIQTFGTKEWHIVIIMLCAIDNYYCTSKDSYNLMVTSFLWLGPEFGGHVSLTLLCFFMNIVSFLLLYKVYAAINSLPLAIFLMLRLFWHGPINIIFVIITLRLL